MSTFEWIVVIVLLAPITLFAVLTFVWITLKVIAICGTHRMAKRHRKNKDR